METGETTTLRINSANFHSDAINFLLKDLRFEEVTISSYKPKEFKLSLFFQGIKIPNTINMLGTFGTKFMRFEGDLFNQIIKLILLVPLDFSENKIDIQLDFNFNQWKNKDINNLKDFDQIHIFLNKFRKANFDTEFFLSFEEKELFSAFGKIDTIELNQMISLVNYTYLARVISSRLNQPIIFDETISFTNDEFNLVHDIYKHTITYQQELKITDTITATFEKGKLDQSALASKKASYLEFRGNLPTKLNLFNHIIELPKTKIAFSSVTPQIISAKNKDIVKFHPSEKSTITYSFQ